MVVGRFLESVWVLSGRVICHALSDNVVTLKKEASASHVCALEKTPCMHLLLVLVFISDMLRCKLDQCQHHGSDVGELLQGGGWFLDTCGFLDVAKLKQAMGAPAGT